MLIAFMSGGFMLGIIHRLGMAGKIPHYGIESIKPKFRLGALLVLAVCIAPYAETVMGFTLMLLCFVGAWKIAQIFVDVGREHF